MLTWVHMAAADYQCLCNYHLKSMVYPRPDTDAVPTGYLHEFDCKPTYTLGPDLQNWEAVQFENQVISLILFSLNLL